MQRTAYFCLFHSGEIYESDCIVLNCKESICHKCLLEHVKKEIDSGNSIFFCPHSCKPETEISSLKIRKIVENTIYAQKYEELLIKSLDKNKYNEEIKSNKEKHGLVKEKNSENLTIDDLKTMKKNQPIDNDIGSIQDENPKTKKRILGSSNNTSAKPNFEKKIQNIKNIDANKNESQRIQNIEKKINPTKENSFTEEELKTKKIKKKKKEDKEAKEINKCKFDPTNDSSGDTAKRNFGENHSPTEAELNPKPNVPQEEERKIEIQQEKKRIEEYIKPNSRDEEKKETNEKRINCVVGAEGSQSLKNEKKELKDQKLDHSQSCFSYKCSLI